MTEYIKKKIREKGQVFFTEFQLTKVEGMREAEKSPLGKQHSNNYCKASPPMMLN